jgi:multiple sugar transport system permease protein/cellobiose transport system permease protein
MGSSLQSANNRLRIAPYLFTVPFFLFYAGFVVYPVLYSFFISLTNWDSLAGINKRQFVGIANYIQLIAKDKLFFRALGNTVFFMVINIPVLIVAGLLMSVVLYKINQGRRIFQTINILPYIITPAAIGLIFSFIFDWSTGIVNTLLINANIIEEGINWLGTPYAARFVIILMVVWKNFGYYMLIYLAALAAIPNDINEAAGIDGAGVVQSFLYITLPMLRSITVFLILTSIISGFQLYDEPILLFSNSGSAVLGGPDRSGLTSIMYFYDRTFRSSTRLGYGATISYALFFIIMVTSVIMSKILNRKDG